MPLFWGCSRLPGSHYGKDERNESIVYQWRRNGNRRRILIPINEHINSMGALMEIKETQLGKNSKHNKYTPINPRN